MFVVCVIVVMYIQIKGFVGFYFYFIEIYVVFIVVSVMIGVVQYFYLFGELYDRILLLFCEDCWCFILRLCFVNSDVDGVEDRGGCFFIVRIVIFGDFDNFIECWDGYKFIIKYFIFQCYRMRDCYV